MQAKPVFTVPTESTRKKAIGSFIGASKLTTGALNAILPLFKPIPQPNPGDWLAEKNETGQTFEDFVKNKKGSSKIKTVRIQPLEENIDEELLRVLQAFAQAYFNPVRVVICLPLNIGELGAEARVNAKSETFQYQAASVLEKLELLFSEDECCTMGVTMTDLYSREDRNFVYGLASSQARVGVFSFARLCDGFVDQARLIWRSSMVITHEIGHMFGLKHCIYFSCMMNGATHLEEENKPFYLCPVCLRKLQHAIGFNFAERYKNLGAVCKELGNDFLEASKWYNQAHKLIMQSYGNNYQKYLEEEKSTKILKNPVISGGSTKATTTTVKTSSLNKKGPGNASISNPKLKQTSTSTGLVSIPVAKNNIKSQLDLYKGL